MSTLLTLLIIAWSRFYVSFGSVGFQKRPVSNRPIKRPAGNAP